MTFGGKKPASRVSQQRPLHRLYDSLFAEYGQQKWWPASTPTEVIIGAVLTQNTAWTNVERAIDNLRRAGALDWKRLRDLTFDELSELIRPAGTFRVKARRLKTLVDRIWREHGGSIASLLEGELEEVRARLLVISGIGPETADAILLYAAGRPTFVVDTYTMRILRRHHVIDRRAKYEEVRSLFQEALPTDVQLYNEYHALLVAVGKKHCRSRARCERCPLAGFAHDPEL